VTRLLGIDLGERRIGLSIADGDGSPARPLETIRRGKTLAQDAERIGTIAAANDVVELVVGLPLEASGNSGRQAESTRQWVSGMNG
jgi:putative Holliday junction resolvase